MHHVPIHARIHLAHIGAPLREGEGCPRYRSEEDCIISLKSSCWLFPNKEFYDIEMNGAMMFLILGALDSILNSDELKAVILQHATRCVLVVFNVSSVLDSDCHIFF